MAGDFFDGKFVTGGSRETAAATVRVLADPGAHIVIDHASSRDPRIAEI